MYESRNLSNTNVELVLELSNPNESRLNDKFGLNVFDVSLETTQLACKIPVKIRLVYKRFISICAQTSFQLRAVVGKNRAGQKVTFSDH